jgi:hypothetical protein
MKEHTTIVAIYNHKRKAIVYNHTLGEEKNPPMERPPEDPQASRAFHRCPCKVFHLGNDDFIYSLILLLFMCISCISKE